MALHTALLNEQSRELVPARMQYPVESSGLLGTSKIMQYKSPDFGQKFSGESGNNIIRFTMNGPGLLDPRSLYIRWSWENQSGKTFAHCDPGSYSPIKRVRILSGFNQQILYDLDGYNTFCAFLDDYQKSVHDFATDTHGFYALRTSPIVIGTDALENKPPGLSTSYISDAPAAAGTVSPISEFLQWEFRPKTMNQNSTQATTWLNGEKLFSVCDLPHIGIFTQGKYIPLWGLGGIIIELYLDAAQNWCTVDGNPADIASTQVEISDVELYYDNIVPPAKFLETMREVIDSPEGLSFVFPSVNRHLNSVSEIPADTLSRKTELLVPDHSRMAQAIFQVFRPQQGTSAWNRVYKLHNRTTAGILSWQAKLNSSYLPQQPLRANRPGAAAPGSAGTRKYLQFHKELMKGLGQQRRSVGSVTPTLYELDSCTNVTALYDGATAKNKHRGAFAVGIDMTVSDDVITGTNLRNATVTGEMFINIEQSNPVARVYPAIEVQTYIMKLSQIRLTSAGPILVD